MAGQEFAVNEIVMAKYGGEFRQMPDPNTASDEQWADYIFNRNGEPSVKREWWHHIASGTWFLAERDNVTDEIVRTYLYDGEGAR